MAFQKSIIFEALAHNGNILGPGSYSAPKRYDTEQKIGERV